MKGRFYPGYVLTVLFTVYVFNFIDRQILSILIDPVRNEFQVSDAAMGFLTGSAFALFYTLAGIPIARLADRTNRTIILAAGVALWSLMTVLSGLATSFWQLVLARIGIGIGEATCVPCSHSILSDYFDPKNRATALSVFSMGAYGGVMAGFFLGGWVNELYGWRWAFFSAGLPGVFLGILVLATVREPVRGASEFSLPSANSASLREALGQLTGLRSLVFGALGASFSSFTGYALILWSPVLLIRSYGMGTGEAGLWLGLVSGVGGVTGTLLGGVLGDRLARRGAGWYFWLPAFSQLASIPLALLFLRLRDPLLSLPVLALVQVLGTMWMGPTYAAAQGLVVPRMRSLVAACLLLAINLIGLGLGPLAVGILNDMLSLRFGSEAVRYSLAFALVGSLLAAVHYGLGARRLAGEWPSPVRGSGVSG